MLLSEIIHARAGREVVSILRAAMQHDEQTPPADWVTARNIKLVAAATGGARKGAAQELSPLRDLERLAVLNNRQGIQVQTSKLTPGDGAD
jgi:hypothetical protein